MTTNIFEVKYLNMSSSYADCDFVKKIHDGNNCFLSKCMIRHVLIANKEFFNLFFLVDV